MYTRVFGLVVLLSAIVPAQQIVLDVNPTVITGPSAVAAHRPGVDGARLFFAADDGIHGAEPWVTDGTAAGTHLFADVIGGSFGSAPRDIVPFQGGVVLRNSSRIWRADGTAGGTISLLPTGSAISEPFVVGNRVFFGALTPVGTVLWVSDGTVGGPIASLGSVDLSNSLQFDRLGTELVYIANDFVFGSRLYRSNGTSTGTVQLTTPTPTTSVDAMAVVGSDLFFGTTGVAGGELWVTDGSAAGTQLVRGGFVGRLRTLTAFGDKLLFVADDGVLGLDPFVSDGTASGTVRLADTVAISLPLPFPTITATNQFEVVGSNAFFPATDLVHGSELWVTDGTPGGTSMVRDILPGDGESFLYVLTAVGNHVFFVMDDGTHGPELWRSDGSLAGTTLVRDIVPAGSSGIPFALAAFGSELFFAVDDGVHGTEPWFTDGTSAGTRLLADLNTLPGDAFPRGRSSFVRRQVFGADDGVHGREPWITDGTTQGTVMLDDLNPGAGSSSFDGGVEWNGRFYFANRDAMSGSELWVSDGIPGSSSLFMDIVPGPFGSSPERFTPFGDRLLFVAESELYVTDGTVPGTQKIDIDSTSTASPTAFVRVGDRVYFVAHTSGFGRELWVTDGTAAGTAMVRDILPGSQFPLITGGVALGDRLLFSATTAMFFHPVQPLDANLWVSDGTNAGTMLLLDLAPGQPRSSVDGLVTWQGKAWFLGTNLTPGPFGLGFGTDLWCSDGTVAGTQLVVAGVDAFGPLVPADDRLFFVKDGELWASDGTVMGTALVVDIRPGGRSEPTELTSAGDGTRIVFTADDGLRGRELWTSDGTATGTLPLADIRVGSEGSMPTDLERVGNRIYFRANDGLRGEELWSMHLADVGGSLAEAFGLPCPGTHGGPRIAASVAPSLGANLTITLDAALANVPAALLIGFGLHPGGGQVGCVGAIAPPAFDLIAPTGATGQSSISIAISSNPAFVGFEFFARWLVLDPNGGFFGALAFSDVLDVLVGS